MILSPPLYPPLNWIKKNLYNSLFLNLFLEYQIKFFLKSDALNDIKHKVFLFDEHVILRHNYFFGGKVDIIL